MSDEKYALLRTFRGLFEGKPYRHRIANLGDLVASQLYEDLVALGETGRERPTPRTRGKSEKPHDWKTGTTWRRHIR